MKKIIQTLSLYLLLLTVINAQVLLIESYHSDYAWDKSYIEGIENVLKGKHNLVKFQMDTKRVPKDQYQTKADEAWKTYEELKPKLVMLGDDNALKFLGEKFSKTSTPVVFLGINNNPKAYNIKGATNITGVLERPLLKRNLMSIGKILGKDAPKILVLFDNGSTSQVTFKEVFKGKSTAKYFETTVDIKTIGKYSEWENAIKNAKRNGYDCVIAGLYHTLTDASGKHVPAGNVMKWTSENSTVPLFGFWDFSVGEKMTAGGFVLFGKVQGEIAAQTALKILGGKSPNKIKPIIPENGRYLFSKRQLAKWNLKLTPKLLKEAEYVK